MSISQSMNRHTDIGPAWLAKRFTSTQDTQTWNTSLGQPWTSPFLVSTRQNFDTECHFGVSSSIKVCVQVALAIKHPSTPLPASLSPLCKAYSEYVASTGRVSALRPQAFCSLCFLYTLWSGFASAIVQDFA